jgi:hypothetical protein
MEEPQKLKCPICGVAYDNYREYFACWTNHLEQTIGDTNGSGLIPFDHAEAVAFLKEAPERIELGMRIIASEVGVFHGRIDLVAVDSKKRLVLIDVDNGHDPERKAKQLRRYRKSVQWLGTHIFGLRFEDIPEIRLVIVNPNKYVKDVTQGVLP